MSDKKYFQSVKRGEIAEFRDELNSPNREKQKEVRWFLSNNWSIDFVGGKESDCSYECG